MTALEELQRTIECMKTCEEGEVLCSIRLSTIREVVARLTQQEDDGA
jgi:hypothetical protein